MFLSTVILGVTGDPRGGIADQLAAGAESPVDPQEPGESGDTTWLATVIGIVWTGGRLVLCGNDASGFPMV